MGQFFTQMQINDKVDDVTIERNASSELQVKDGGITGDKIANSTIPETKRMAAASQTITENDFTIHHNNARVVIINVENGGNYYSSSTEAIDAGSVDGQELTIYFRTSTYGTLTIRDGAKTKLRANWRRGLGSNTLWAWLFLQWSEADNAWIETATNDGFGTPSGTNSHVEGESANASGSYAHAEGNYCTANGYASHAQNNHTIASNSYTTSVGSYSNANLRSSLAHASGEFSTAGDAQFKRVAVYGTTTDATQTELLIGNSSHITIPTNHCYAFEAQIAAKRTETSMECAGYRLEGVIKNDNGTTSIVGSVTKTILAEDDASWDVTAEADDTNEALAIKVTGVSGKTIHWVATVHLTEVG